LDAQDRAFGGDFDHIPEDEELDGKGATAEKASPPSHSPAGLYLASFLRKAHSNPCRQAIAISDSESDTSVAGQNQDEDEDNSDSDVDYSDDGMELDFFDGQASGAAADPYAGQFPWSRSHRCHAARRRVLTQMTNIIGVFYSKDRVETVIEVKEPVIKGVMTIGRGVAGKGKSKDTGGASGVRKVEYELLSCGEWMAGCPEGGAPGRLGGRRPQLMRRSKTTQENKRSSSRRTTSSRKGTWPALGAKRTEPRVIGSLSVRKRIFLLFRYVSTPSKERPSPS
jgi:hypothetical protein